MEKYIIRVDKIFKTFFLKKGEKVEAVKGVSLDVKVGEIFGFLGPNGAGKSTTLDMLTTLLSPTSGDATICGFDLLRHPQQVRKHIGYVSQIGGADNAFNAHENLVLQARLYGVEKNKASKIANELIERFQMKDFFSRAVSTYSGGQKRRLELALGIIHRPKLLFLDEPTTGLDPQSRAYFWQEIKKLKDEGMTVFLTTHYLEEADNLCDRISIIDHGIIIDTDSPLNMKKQIGSESINIDFLTSNQAEEAKKKLDTESFIKKLCLQDNRVTLFVANGSVALSDVMHILSSSNIATQTIGISQPSLDDVFLQKTGRSLRESKN
jgi:ABC-2 type transport system ATP-binding protein